MPGLEYFHTQILPRLPVSREKGLQKSPWPYAIQPLLCLLSLASPPSPSQPPSLDSCCCVCKPSTLCSFCACFSAWKAFPHACVELHVLWVPWLPTPRDCPCLFCSVLQLRPTFLTPVGLVFLHVVLASLELSEICLSAEIILTDFGCQLEKS